MPKPPPETLAWLRHAASCGKADAHLTLHIMDRLEALERRPIPGTVELAAPTPEAAPVATDEGLVRCYAQAVEDALKAGHGIDGAAAAGLRALYDLGRQHDAAQPPVAQPTPSAAPAEALAARPLLEQVAAMADCIDAEWAEIMAISNRAAAWLRDNPPGQPVAVEPRGCPTPGACSCVEPAPGPAPSATPAGGLVERVADEVTGQWHQNDREAARAVIREVAYFLGDLGYRAAKADLLEQVAGR
jgi:hypothetical protein